METIEEICELYLEPRILCSGQPVITAGNFLPLAIDIAELETVEYSVNEVVSILRELSLKFSACGANSGGNQAVLRKYAKTGFTYITEKIKKSNIDC